MCSIRIPAVGPGDAGIAVPWLVAGSAIAALVAGIAVVAFGPAVGVPAGGGRFGGAVDRQDTTHSGDEYWRRGYFQEAAWAYEKAGRSADRERALDTLRRILLSPPRASRPPERDPREPGTNDRALLLDFGGGISAFFKPEGSLLRCLMCDVRYEAAAWKIDSIAGFDLVPMTVLASVGLGERGVPAEWEEAVLGSIQYFVRDAHKAYVAFSPGSDFVSVEEHKPDRLRFFDALIGNADRHGGNWLVRETGEIVAIDNDNIFAHDYRWAPTRWPDQVAAIADPRELVSSALFSKVKALPDSVWIDLLSGLVPADRLALFLRTRKEIVAALEARARAGDPLRGSDAGQVKRVPGSLH